MRHVLLFPGQGSQQVGMGEALFRKYERETVACSEVLGYSLQELCAQGPMSKLSNTLYTQPALYVVNALAHLEYRDNGGAAPAFAAGLSLGEYSALFAAGAFDLLTGLRIVQQRAQLMAAARDGGMIAVVGVGRADVERCLREERLSLLDFANENSFTQVVLAGPAEALPAARDTLMRCLQAEAVILPVGGAFHSRYMRPAQEVFSRVLADVSFSPLEFPVLSNVTGKPHRQDAIGEMLGQQLTSTVKWLDSVTHVLDELGDPTFVELGPGRTLTSLTGSIAREWSRRRKAETTPLPERAPEASRPARRALGSASFRARYGVRHAYVAGAMAHGISSPTFVSRMAHRGLLSFYGTGGVPLEEIDRGLDALRPLREQQLPFGVNLLAGDQEEDVVDLLLRHEVGVVEASAFVDISPALVRYRLTGLRAVAGGVVIGHRVIAKISRPDVAQRFMSPAPPKIVEALLARRAISPDEAMLAARVPMADDISVEGNSGGHTSPAASIMGLLPDLRLLRDEMMAARRYPEPIHVGAGGGIGHPDAAAMVFLLGADYVLTGSINQCTVEAATSDLAKTMLLEADVFDTDFAPSADMFEIGAQVQVLKRGTLYASRARRLQELYRTFNAWDDIDAETRAQLERSYLRAPFDEVLAHAVSRGTPAQGELAARLPKHRMALVFRWYCANASRLARSGDPARKADFQIWTGPAIGSFNRWSRARGADDWRSRHVDDIAEHLIGEAGERLGHMIARGGDSLAAVARAATPTVR